MPEEPPPPARVVAIMQNAWSRFFVRLQGFDEPEPASIRHRIWAREDWLQATRASKSGKTLLRIFPEVACDDQYGPRWPPPGVWLDDATLKVTAEPSGVEPPDEDYLRRLLAAKRPELVLACGKLAGAALARLWPGPLVVMPHPAYRLLNRATIDAVADAVSRPGEVGRVLFASKLRDGRQTFLMTSLGPPAATAGLFPEPEASPR